MLQQWCSSGLRHIIDLHCLHDLRWFGPCVYISIKLQAPPIFPLFKRKDLLDVMVCKGSACVTAAGCPSWTTRDPTLAPDTMLCTSISCPTVMHCIHVVTILTCANRSAWVRRRLKPRTLLLTTFLLRLDLRQLVGYGMAACRPHRRVPTKRAKMAMLQTSVPRR